MLIVSQCGTGFFNSRYFVGAWIKGYSETQFQLKAIFGDKEVILGVYHSKDDAKTALNKLFNNFRHTMFASEPDCVYRI